MKIAFIGQKGIPARFGGIERYAEDLSVRLVKAGHEVYVYTRPYYTPKREKEYQGVKLISLPTLRTKHLDAITHSFLASIDVIKKDFDIIHYQNIGPALVSWIPKLFKRNIKIIATLQSRDYEHKKWGIFARFMLRTGEFIMCLTADEVIVVNESMKKYVKEKYGLEAIIIPNGTNENEIIASQEIKKWGLEKDNYIVSISRLIRHKGIHYLIEAYKTFKTDKKLVIVGEGAFTDDYVKELKTLAGDNKNIIFTGNLQGKILAEVFSNAYLFVQPSESEGLSLALLEAMSYSRGTLVSDIKENVEAIGETGFVFKNKDVASLKEQLGFLMENPELVKEKGEQARVRVKKEYNWDDITEKMILTYNKAGRKNFRFNLFFRLFKFHRA